MRHEVLWPDLGLVLLLGLAQITISVADNAKLFLSELLLGLLGIEEFLLAAFSLC